MAEKQGIQDEDMHSDSVLQLIGETVEVCFYEITDSGEKTDNLSGVHTKDLDKTIKSEALLENVSNVTKLITNLKRRVNETKSFKCDHCQKVFKRKCSLKKHMLLHMGKHEVIDNECSETLNDCVDTENVQKKEKCADSPNRAHVQLNNADNVISKKRSPCSEDQMERADVKYECDVCHKTFAFRNSYRTHVQTHKLQWQCDICDQTFVRKENLKNHILVHTGERAFQCEICQLCFSLKGTLNRHRTTHFGAKPYICEFCQKCFTQKTGLTVHLRLHTGIKPYKCDICQKAFTQKVNLNEHLPLHRAEKSYECEFCYKRFATNTNCRKHQARVHPSGEVKIPSASEVFIQNKECEICHKKFAHRSTLMRHIKAHGGEKPWVCEICNKAFQEKSNLKKHRMYHSGEKPFECTVCQKCFVDKGTLDRHRVSHFRTKAIQPL